MQTTIAGSQRPLGYEVTLVPSLFRMGGRASLFASSRDISLENFVMSLLGHVHLRRVNESILAKKKVRYQFFCRTIFSTNFVNNLLGLLVCKINFLNTFRIVDFLNIFFLIKKYSKHSLELIFGWECNDTPSLRYPKIRLKFVHSDF